MKNKKEILSSSKNVVESPSIYKGSWNKEFNNNNDIHLEIGTGRCNFIINNALKYKNINFIGIERIDTVLAQGVKKIEEYIPNLRLINYDANLLCDIFDKEISTIYLNFSDPWPKDRHAKRRLTNKRFLKIYESIFKGVNRIVMKTDNKDLFDYSIEELKDFGYTIKKISLDLQKEEKNDNIMTEYEEKFMKNGCKIYMLEAEK